MWSFYEWMTTTNSITEIIKTESGTEPRISMHSGAARNLPLFIEELRLKKLSLKSREVVDHLKSASLTTEVVQALRTLRHIEIPKRVLHYPCTNPLFIELRLKALEIRTIGDKNLVETFLISTKLRYSCDIIDI
jgi:hypothetical protein